MLAIELSIIVVLVVVNGALAMSELAVVSSRPAHLRALTDRGVVGASRALALASDPGKFLSSVQIGITLVGVLSGAFSGATLGLRLTNWLVEQGVRIGIANALGVGIVVVLITYGSLIIGELVPKQIALRNPEGIAANVAPAMVWLAWLGAPLVWLLDLSGRAVLRILGQEERDQGDDLHRCQITPVGIPDIECEDVRAAAKLAAAIDMDVAEITAVVKPYFVRCSLVVGSFRWFGCLSLVATKHAGDRIAEENAAGDAHRRLRGSGEEPAASPLRIGSGVRLLRRRDRRTPDTWHGARDACRLSPKMLESRPPEDCRGPACCSSSSIRACAALSACSCTTMVCAM